MYEIQKEFCYNILKNSQLRTFRGGQHEKQTICGRACKSS